MANRHSHKKLRAEIRARMEASGESYQAARHRILGRRQRRDDNPDLLAATYFGVPVTIATFGVLSRLHVVLVSGGAGPLRSPLGSPLFLHTRGVLQ
jgi:hypothetical protein